MIVSWGLQSLWCPAVISLDSALTTKFESIVLLFLTLAASHPEFIFLSQTAEATASARRLPLF